MRKVKRVKPLKGVLALIPAEYNDMLDSLSDIEYNEVAAELKARAADIRSRTACVRKTKDTPEQLATNKWIRLDTIKFVRVLHDKKLEKDRYDWSHLPKWDQPEGARGRQINVNDCAFLKALSDKSMKEAGLV